MSDLRESLSHKYLSGFGVEIGAELSPTAGPNISGLAVVDKRSPEEFEALFGQPPPYEILSPARGRELFRDRVDFIVAHHVAEHCDNPIYVLVNQWLPMLKEGGILYLSLPSATHGCENLHLATPIDHLLDDYYFERPSVCYESKSHIYSFILQWTVFRPGDVWFANSDQISYAAETLRAALPEIQDLHWHTYTMRIASQVIEAAFYEGNFGLEWLHQDDSGEELHLVCRRTRASRQTPPFLLAYRDRLMTAAGRI